MTMANIHQEIDNLRQLGMPGLTGMRIFWIESEEQSEWDRFVEGHPDGTIYHHGAWRRVLEEVCGHLSGRVLVLRDGEGGPIQAGLPVYSARSLLLGERFVSSPFGTLGGPLTSSSDQFLQLTDEVARKCSIEGMRCAEIRGLRSIVVEPQGFGVSSGHLHHYIDLEVPWEELKSSCSKSVKRRLAKQRKFGIEIREERDVEAIEMFSSQLAKLRRRLGLPTYPFNLVQAMMKHLPESAVSLLVARSEGEFLGGFLELQLGDWAIFEQVADTEKGRFAGVNHHLLWASIQRAHEAKRKFYSLGRTSPDNAGLLQFKRSWGTIEEPLWNLSFPPREAGASPDWKMRLLRNVASWGFGRSPDSVAKVMSRFFYRHWA